MPKLKIMYVASEIAPFLNHSFVAESVKKLSQYTQEHEAEIRILVPRFGLINERKNRLHEVVRLSRTNIKIGDKISTLMIKVASVPHTKLQVYFIDSEEYFKRKALFHDGENQPFQDNDERTIFFCKGVLETTKKLEWPPDIIHCHDWMTSLIPMYMKTAYSNEPILKNAKVVWTLYNNVINDKWQEDMLAKVSMGGMRKDALTPLAKDVSFQGLIKTGLQYADSVTRAEPLKDPLYQAIPDNVAIPYISCDEAGMEAYSELYTALKAKAK